MSSNLETSVQYLKSIGPKRAESFASIGVNTIQDLLFYFPTRHLDRSTILNSVKVLQHVINGYDGEVTIIGEVISKETIRARKKQIFKVRMKDAAGVYECVWFQGLKYFKDIFNEGEKYALSGKPVLTRYGNLQFAHPDFDRLGEKESLEFINTGKIIPFYRLPKELKSTNIGDTSLRRIISAAVEEYAELLSETLPQSVLKKNNLLEIKSAVSNIHFPQSVEQLNQAMERFKYEELFYLESLIALRKYAIKHRNHGTAFKIKPTSITKFLNSLPFKLTDSQLKVLTEIRKDMESNVTMNRLLQGDVGSGKTIVALIAMLIAVDNDKQSVIMAPTEILANQHYHKITEYLKNFKINVGLLIGGQKKSERTKLLKKIAAKEFDIVIGTHALFEEDVNFNNIGLVVIDEQHRFGVAQRSRLIEKGILPNVLIMTATPIPRTLSMTVYGDLDISIIDQMPLNRTPIKTYLRGEKKLPDIYKFIVDKKDEGYQTFIVYPLVAESEKLDLKSAEEYFENLRSGYLKNMNVGLIHGKMKWQEKEEMMKKFSNKEFDVLISTTVIEVGIDIPDANIIVINDAHRFGLSQLHQLRGRIGRSDKQGYSILVTKDEFAIKSEQFNYDFEYLSKSQIEANKSIIRMNAMLKYISGFDLSEIDMRLRGPGEILGFKQSGFPELKFSNLVTDKDLISKARSDAFNIVEKDPSYMNDDHRIIKNILEKNYSDKLKFSFIG